MGTKPEIDKQSAILEATLDIIAERGFHDAPMSLVARRSGVSTGIIYHYFANKEALIHALYASIKRDFSAALVAGDPQDLPWPQHLHRVWLNAFNFYVAHPRQTLFLEQYENSPYQQEWHTPGYDDNMTMLMDVITADVEQGYVRPMPFDVLYELTLGVAVALAKRQISGSIQLDADELATIAAACSRAIEPLA